MLAATLCLLVAPPLAGALSGCGSSGTDASAPRSTFVGLASQDAYDGTPSYQDATLARQAKAGCDCCARRSTGRRSRRRPAATSSTASRESYVADAARAGIEVMPILFNTPGFLARSAGGERGGRDPASPPKDPETMARFRPHPRQALRARRDAVAPAAATCAPCRSARGRCGTSRTCPSTGAAGPTRRQTRAAARRPPGHPRRR